MPYLFGTISHGTMLPVDLIPVFCNALRDVRGSVPREIWLRAQACMRNDMRMANDGQEVVIELSDALDANAPSYHYFGAHVGDNSDYGFWLAEDFRKQMKEEKVLEVDDLSAVPEKFTGDVLHVNDHGNITFYIAHKGRLQEIWSYV